MELLRFDRFGKAAPSPINLRFTDDPAPPAPQPVGLVTRITLGVNQRIVTPRALRFSDTYTALVSPIALKYGQDVFASITTTIPLRLVLDITTTEIIIDRSFGIEVGFGWADLNPVQQALLLANAVTDHTIEISAAHDSITPINTDVWLDSYTGPSIDIHHITPLFTPDYTGATFYVSWALPEGHHVTTAAAWTLPQGHQVNNRLQWLAVPAEQLHTSLQWWDGHKHEIAHSLRYRGMVVGNEPVVAWGYTAPRWICSTKYRPPVSKINLSFTVTTAEAEAEHHLPARVH